MKKYLLSMLAVLFCLHTYGQTATVTGTIKTSDEQTAAFVNVGLKGTNKGSSTDKEGKYEIKM